MIIIFCWLFFLTNVTVDNKKIELYIRTNTSFSELLDDIRPYLKSETSFILASKLKKYHKNVKPGSALEKRAIRHEKQHLKDMADPKIGLSYGDDYVRYKGKTYPRKDGKIKYNGKWHEEGSKAFPWATSKI